MPFPSITVVAVLTALLVQYLLKPLISLWIKPTDTQKYNTAVRAAAVICGIILSLINAGTLLAGTSLLLALGSGVISGLTAVGGYTIGREFTS